MVKYFVIFLLSYLSWNGIGFSEVSANIDYQLQISKGKIITNNQKTYITVSATLTNNTDDTLKYFSMSCSWPDFYTVDTSNLQIDFQGCDKNFPIILILPPKQSNTNELNLFARKPKDLDHIKLKIGFNLIIAKSTEIAFNFNYEFLKKNKNVIWSNTIKFKE